MKNPSWRQTPSTTLITWYFISHILLNLFKGLQIQLKFLVLAHAIARRLLFFLLRRPSSPTVIYVIQSTQNSHSSGLETTTQSLASWPYCHIIIRTPFLVPNSQTKRCLNDSFVYDIQLFIRIRYSPNVHYSLDLFFRLLTIHLHSILCQSVSATIQFNRAVSCGYTRNSMYHVHVAIV